MAPKTDPKETPEQLTAKIRSLESELHGVKQRLDYSERTAKEAADRARLQEAKNEGYRDAMRQFAALVQPMQPTNMLYPWLRGGFGPFGGG